jgi:hypothetical protein
MRLLYGNNILLPDCIVSSNSGDLRHHYELTLALIEMALSYCTPASVKSGEFALLAIFHFLRQFFVD